ncbi:hypothetical protein [Bradyrhizobium sp. LHD-71]|uniref:hypothetical protein n=1 Tax=Bradyrhizobium sp. LHD-71 TaxID=3072141 RepID=UPI00280DB0E0|nr:hypothetical protein [Bradyrhizobium sp. LHD-71]MDQ8729502.1 hypothetical protein [Bradyrhizobium sp. LHD-71]
MREKDETHKNGLPPRERNADVTERGSNPIAWTAGLIIACAIAALALFGTTRTNDTTTASDPTLNTAPGTTTGSVPAPPSKGAEQ